MISQVAKKYFPDLWIVISPDADTSSLDWKGKGKEEITSLIEVEIFFPVLILQNFSFASEQICLKINVLCFQFIEVGMRAAISFGPKACKVNSEVRATR